MEYWTIEPMIFSGAELEYPDSLDLEEIEDYDTVLVISNIPGKKFSIAVRITKRTISKSSHNPIIKIDKSIIGPFAKGDKVLLKKFIPPIAKLVLLVINSKFYLAEGNWGNNIVNKAISNHILDIGQSIDFMYGTEKPMLVSGIVKATVPKAPALVDEKTNFIIEKYSQDKITTLQIEADSYKEKRAIEYLELIDEEFFDFLTAIRSESVNKIEKTFNFSQINPKNVYSTFKQTLASDSYSFLYDTFEQIEDTVLASLLASPRVKKGEKPPYIIEFKLSGKVQQGMCLIIGYSKKMNLIDSLISNLEKQLKKISLTFKEIPQAIPDTCGGCNARLNLIEQNFKGIIICHSCKTPNLLPYTLRV
jgi:hypothetical protein